MMDRVDGRTEKGSRETGKSGQASDMLKARRHGRQLAVIVFLQPLLSANSLRSPHTASLVLGKPWPFMI